MAIVKTLKECELGKEGSNEVVYPVTTIDAIFDRDGNSLADLIYKPIEILKFTTTYSGVILPEGLKIPELYIQWELSKQPTDLYLDSKYVGGRYKLPKKKSGSYKLESSVLNAITVGVTPLTLYAKDSKMETPVQSKTEIKFGKFIYYLTSTKEKITAEDISKASKYLSDSPYYSGATFDTGDDKYGFYVIPSSYSNYKFRDERVGFVMNMDNMGTVRIQNNLNGLVGQYVVWRTMNPGVGSIKISIIK